VDSCQLADDLIVHAARVRTDLVAFAGTLAGLDLGDC
jgi:hypothetical protein